MPRIRWEEDWDDDGYKYWLGYIGKFQIAKIEPSCSFFEVGCIGEDFKDYTKLSSAKRGAERMLDKFLKDAGLEVKDA